MIPDTRRKKTNISVFSVIQLPQNNFIQSTTEYSGLILDNKQFLI